MPKKFLLHRSATVAVALLLLGASCATSRAQSAEEMASDCKGIVQAKVYDEGEKGMALSIPDNVSSGTCWGAFLSFQSAIFYVGYEYPDGTHSQTPRPFFGICAPTDVSTSQLIKVFVHYTDAHPEKLNDGFFQVALDAGKYAFPCKSSP